MVRPLVHSLLIGLSLLPLRSFAEPTASPKVRELSQARELVERLEASSRKSRVPILGVLRYWNFRVNTYDESYAQQLDRPSVQTLYYDCCRAIEKRYKPQVATFLHKSAMGYPHQVTVVNFEDEDFGKSHLIAGIWEGNDSTEFYCIHLPGSYDLKEGWNKRESWGLDDSGFSDAKAPLEKFENEKKPTPSK